MRSGVGPAAFAATARGPRIWHARCLQEGRAYGVLRVPARVLPLLPARPRAAPAARRRRQGWSDVHDLAPRVGSELRREVGTRLGAARGARAASCRALGA